MADRISKYFVPIVILLTIIAWIIWFSYAYSQFGYENVELNGLDVHVIGGSQEVKLDDSFLLDDIEVLA